MLKSWRESYAHMWNYWSWLRKYRYAISINSLCDFFFSQQFEHLSWIAKSVRYTVAKTNPAKHERFNALTIETDIFILSAHPGVYCHYQFSDILSVKSSERYMRQVRRNAFVELYSKVDIKRSWGSFLKHANDSTI